MDILLGILLVVLGLAITFMGIQVFFATLPLLGFIFGFFLGAAGWEALFGDGFLGTVTGWIVGVVVGIVFALLSWFWWYAGVLLSAGALGAVLGTGLVEAFGGDSEWLLFIVGAIGFIAVIVATYLLNLPIFMVIVNTAFAGATVVITGVLLVFNRVNYEELGYGTAVAIIQESWWWALVWSVLAVVGMFFQLSMKAAVELPEERWINAQSAARI
jgi:hypothetical protein